MDYRQARFMLDGSGTEVTESYTVSKLYKSLRAATLFRRTLLYLGVTIRPTRVGPICCILWSNVGPVRCSNRSSCATCHKPVAGISKRSEHAFPLRSSRHILQMLAQLDSVAMTMTMSWHAESDAMG